MLKREVISQFKLLICSEIFMIVSHFMCVAVLLIF